MKARHLARFSAGILALATASTNAHAQAATAETEAEQAGIGDIVVTAQRREESLQSAAVAVDVVSNSAILNAGVTKASDLQNLVPSLQITGTGGSNSSFFLRGVGTFSNNSYSDPAIAFNYDGVYVGRPAGTSGVFYDLDRVEVLKGPQGTLYGRNATGGAINVIPTRPKIGQTSGFLSASYGNYNAFNAQGAINLATSSTTALRLSGTVVNRDGYLSDGTSDDKGFALRGQFLAELGSDVTLRIAADYYKQDGKGGGSNFINRIIYNPVAQTYVIQPSGLAQNVGALDPLSGAFLSHTFMGLSGNLQAPLQRTPFLDNSAFGVTSELTWDAGFATLTLQPAYRRFRQNGIQDGLGVLIETHELDEQYSLEARLASNGSGPLTWLLGGYYYKEDIDSDFRVQQQDLDSFQLYTQGTKSVAAFARLSYALTDSFRLVAGGRYTHDTKAFAGKADVLQSICTYPAGAPCLGTPVLPYGTSALGIIGQLGLVNVAPGVYILPTAGAANSIFTFGSVPINQSRGDGRFTYRLGFEWDAGEHSLVYASYETGFRSGGFAFSLAKPTFSPEKIEAFTLGTKNRFLDNTVQVNLEAFYWKYRDQQVSHLGQDPSVGLAYFTENIGRSTNKGAELELVYQPRRNTRISADIQYLDAKYDSFVYTQPALAGGVPTPFPLVGCAVTSPAALTPTAVFSIDCSGKPSQQSPKWTANFGAQQTFNLGSVDLTIEASTRYQSQTVTGFEFIGQQIQQGYWNSGAALTIASPSDTWTATAFVSNIENNRAGTYTFVSGITSTIAQTTTAPRTYGIRVGLKF